MNSNGVPYLAHLPWTLLSVLGIALTAVATYFVMRNRRNFEFAAARDSGLPAAIAVASLAAIGLAGCGNADAPASAPPFITDLNTLGAAVAVSIGYPVTAVEVTGNASRLRIALSDGKLAALDGTAREELAATVVATAERQLAALPSLSAMQAISVALMHVEDAAGAAVPNKWHIEDVMDYRKGPNQRFTIHATS